ncbi:uncharacterized membrane protein (DUF485 family) [Peribacillus sp. V2I11]|nr:uncharacterized membrane protein (DUF485 family) [Peribacillus sp. V2I11]
MTKKHSPYAHCTRGMFHFIALAILLDFLIYILLEEFQSIFVRVKLIRDTTIIPWIFNIRRIFFQ